MLYPILSKTLLPLLLRRVKHLEGLENLPKNRPFIFCANHLGYLEGIFIKAVMIRHVHRNVYFIAKEIYWRFFKKFIGQKATEEWLGMIPRLNVEPAGSLAVAGEYLKKGAIIGIFPEGTRNFDPQFLLKGKTGAVRLALKARVPVVPMGYYGPVTRRKRQGIIGFFHSREKIKIIIGQPIYFDEYYNKEITKELLDELTKKIMLEISKLCGKTYPY